MVVNFNSGAAAILFFTLGSLASAQSTDSSTRLTRLENLNSEGTYRREARIGQIIVDQYAHVFSRYVSGQPPATAKIVIEANLCVKGVGDISRFQVKKLISEMNLSERAMLKSSDAVALRRLAIASIAALDGVSAEAVSRDESFGPGAYHASIEGMMLAIIQCQFTG